MKSLPQIPAIKVGDEVLIHRADGSDQIHTIAAIRAGGVIDTKSPKSVLAATMFNVQYDPDGKRPDTWRVRPASRDE